MWLKEIMMKIKFQPENMMRQQKLMYRQTTQKEFLQTAKYLKT